MNRRVLILIGLVSVAGFAKVSQQTATVLAAYELGKRHAKLHELENDSLWLKTKIVALQSPVHLDKAMANTRLVGWASLPSD